MNILHLATNTMIVARMTAVSGNRMAYSTVTSARGALQPLSNDAASLAGGDFGKSFVFFVDPANDASNDIKEHDKLRDTTTGDEYKVLSGGVTRRTFGSIDYVKVIVSKTS